MAEKVTIEVDAGDAQATYAFLRSSVERLAQIVADMPVDRQYVYLDQPRRWDRVAIALGESVGEVDLPSLIPSDD